MLHIEIPVSTTTKNAKTPYAIWVSVLAPYLLAIASVVISYNRAIEFISPYSILRLLVFVVSFVSLMWLINLKFKDIQKTSLIISLLVIVLFFNLLFLVITATVAVVLGIVMFVQHVKQKNFAKFQKDLQTYILLLGIILFVFSVFQTGSQLAVFPWREGKIIQQFSTRTALYNFKPTLQSDVPTPKFDIYYIILDGYTNAQILRDLHHFDNTPFLDALRARGFYVADHSHSNYMRTQISITSSLNAAYFDWQPDSAVANVVGFWLIDKSLSNNAIQHVLKKLGYSTFASETGFNATSLKNADNYSSPFLIQINQIEAFWIANNSLKYILPLFSKFINIGTFETHRLWVIHGLQYAANVSVQPQPKFVFTHIISPHPPFIFDAQGNPITPSYDYTLSDANDNPLSAKDYSAGYVGQIEFINKQVLQTIDKILAQSVNPPIIVLQGDHGSGMYTDFNSLEDTCVAERFSILNAYYFPDGNYQSLYPSISPVNTFRVIFNQFFGASLPMLPDRQFYNTFSRFYHYTDVTDQLDLPCP